MTTSSRRGAVLAGIGAASIALDQLTKHWAVNALDDGRAIDLFWTFRFKLHFNSGLAFSMATGRGGVLAGLGMVVLVLLVRSVLSWPGRLPVVAGGLVIGGALGNIVDRLFRAGGDGFLGGHVVDFVDAQWWPVFNVADVSLSVGGLLLVLSSFLQRDVPEGDDAEAPTPAATAPG